MIETAWWAVKCVGVLLIVSGAMAALIGSIFEANGETNEEVELDYRDNCRWYHEDRLRNRGRLARGKDAKRRCERNAEFDRDRIRGHERGDGLGEQVPSELAN